MPRKRFLQDLEQVRIDHDISNICDLARDMDDGHITFLFTHSTLIAPVKIHVLASDVGDYPDSHDFMIFADEDAPETVTRAIADRCMNVTRRTIHDTVQLISRALTPNDSSMSQEVNHHEAMDIGSEPDDEDDDDEDESMYDLGTANYMGQALPYMRTSLDSPQSANSAIAALSRAKQDLRMVKEAGFKVSFLSKAVTNPRDGIISIACRIDKLGLSDEAIRAWQLRSENYLVLLLRYPLGYMPFQEVLLGSRTSADLDVVMRILTGPTYKPSVDDAYQAFQETRDPMTENSTHKDTFISRSLVEMMEHRLFRLIHYRSYGLKWCGAEALFNDTDGRFPNTVDKLEDHYFEDETTVRALPNIVMTDHFCEMGPDKFCFPLLAMEFMLRHFVRCTEFCLVCHRKFSEDMEALKPYVCDRPLCLYQYMSLGFGPSIDHEIIAQPQVVDLLVSLCYTSAAFDALKTFPVGLDLKVPDFGGAWVQWASEGLSSSTAKEWNLCPKGVHHNLTSTIELNNNPEACPFTVGQWIFGLVEKVHNPARAVDRTKFEFHCRVLDISRYPIIEVSQLNRRADPYTPMKERASPESVRQHSPISQKLDVKLIGYDKMFDELSHKDRCIAIRFLLDSLPDVDQMSSYLSVKDASLKEWRNRISPSAYGILRWIIASNRACIFAETETHASGTTSNPQRVLGMTNWLQFRFAMGAPDKEYRFNKAIRETPNVDSKHPTSFAWHGSGLKNWHSIIREGLRYDTVTHGRAFGDGCYHSLHLHTSLGYCSSNIAQRPGSRMGPSQWASTLLAPTSVISLNELVNSPNDFTSRTPHLVVQHLDWIQTRYLFVQSHLRPTVDPLEEVTGPLLAQDPLYSPSGVDGKIKIPRRMSDKTIDLPAKRKSMSKGSDAASKAAKVLRKGGRPPKTAIEDDAGDTSSDVTDDEDRQFLAIETGEETELQSLPVPTSRQTTTIKCRFAPGALDHSTLPIMPEPSYASIACSKRLQADLQALVKVQNQSNLAELGWYIDASKIDNLYQWIVELHSFEQFEYNNGELPLAMDMQAMDINSIVMEMRFGASYPMTPPFVRVIRPRFLGFAMGGGGHVTFGGAMCMELLTNSGWTAAMGLENVLLQVRMAMASTDPLPAKLEVNARGVSDYSASQAVLAYRRACVAHGWEVPADLDQTAAGSRAG